MFTIPLSERVGMKLSYEFNRDSTPGDDVKKDDHLLDVGLTVVF